MFSGDRIDHLVWVHPQFRLLSVSVLLICCCFSLTSTTWNMETHHIPPDVSVCVCVCVSGWANHSEQEEEVWWSWGRRLQHWFWVWRERQTSHWRWLGDVWHHETAEEQGKILNLEWVYFQLMECSSNHSHRCCVWLVEGQCCLVASLVSPGLMVVIVKWRGAVCQPISGLNSDLRSVKSLYQNCSPYSSV